MPTNRIIAHVTTDPNDRRSRALADQFFAELMMHGGHPKAKLWPIWNAAVREKREALTEIQKRKEKGPCE